MISSLDFFLTHDPLFRCILPFVPTSLYASTPTFPITIVPTLTYELLSQEQVILHSEIHARLNFAEERISFLKLQVGYLQEELVNLKEEN